VERIEVTLSALLAQAGVPCAAVDTVFFTGGASGVPLLRERIAALLPQARRIEGDLFGSIGGRPRGRSSTPLRLTTPPATAPRCEFNRSMQHTRICVSRRSVADETKNSDFIILKVKKR